MDISKRPAVNRRLLSLALRQLRAAKNETQQKTAAALEWSPAKMRRLEQGQVGVSAVDLRALLDHYGVDDPQEVEKLLKLARSSRTSSLTSRYSDAIPPKFATYLEYEEAAKSIRHFENIVVPGPLQTEEYARAVFKTYTPDIDSDTLEQRLGARMARKEMLQQDEAPAASFVIDEAVLRRPVSQDAAGLSVQLAQLAHLSEMDSYPNIAIQVVRFEAGLYTAGRGPFVILEFYDNLGESILYQENPNGEELNFEDPELIEKYLQRFADAEKLASPAGELNSVLDDIASTLRASS